ncbi:hypothetical protein [Kordia sp.]|uniref:hypothetical protein n=1 Tax=Kordia sp. TaxID=1965332 RepID=UPI003D2D7A53
MKKLLKSYIYVLILLVSCISFGQNKNYKLETTYMNCMYGIFEDDGVKLKELIKKAEQKLIEAKLLKDTSGKSYIALYKNIEKAINGEALNLGISNHVIEGMNNNKKIKEYMGCMQGIMQSKNYEGSKLNQFIKLSSSGSNNTKVTALATKLLTVFEAKDFDHDFYKYLTFSLIDKFNSNINSSKGEKEKP